MTAPLENTGAKWARPDSPQKLLTDRVAINPQHTVWPERTGIEGAVPIHVWETNVIHYVILLHMKSKQSDFQWKKAETQRINERYLRKTTVLAVFKLGCKVFLDRPLIWADTVTQPRLSQPFTLS